MLTFTHLANQFLDATKKYKTIQYGIVQTTNLIFPSRKFL